MCIYSKHKTLYEFHSGEKNGKCRWNEVIYITQIYATSQPVTQIQGFKNMFVGALQETNSNLNYLQAYVLPPPYAEKEMCEKKQHETEKKDYQRKTFSFTTKLLTICFTLLAT